ncbi:MAG TPA: E3 binding domain-containing protein [Armatimonadota bacterium]|nr:E3 binding domain-containing protein [Armatimonadota bacterium]
MVRITLEKLYPDMKEATVGRWLKSEGEPVAEGEPLVELITDKITFELESTGSGILRQIYFREKSVVPVGCTLAALGDSTEALPDIEAENRERIAAWEAEMAASREAAAPAGPRLVAGGPRLKRAEGVRATPSARRLAREHGIDLADVPPPAEGPITEKDVQAYLEKSERGKR